VPDGISSDNTANRTRIISSGTARFRFMKLLQQVRRNSVLALVKVINILPDVASG
jgi:hypothetical protein